MAIKIPIITELQDEGIKRAKREFDKFKGAVAGADGGIVALALVKLEAEALQIPIDALNGRFEVAQAPVHDADLTLQGDDLGVRFHQHRLTGGVALGHRPFQSADIAVQLLQAAIVPLDGRQGGCLGHHGGRAGDQDQAEHGQDSVAGAEDVSALHAPVVPPICGVCKAGADYKRQQKRHRPEPMPLS